MTLTLRWAGRSEVGPVREGNEDSAYAGPRLALIADGVGGMIAGEVASSLALGAMRRLDEDTADDVVDALATALDNANARLREAVTTDPALEGMGTTMTALLWNGAQLGLVHVGDSRAYLLRDGRLQQVTTDHTFVQTLVDEGRITREQARSHPHRSLILQALDGRTTIEPDLTRLELTAGDRFLLCSDGLSDVLREDAITSRLSVRDGQAAADDLVGAALAGGGTDNITCVVVDAVDLDRAEPTTGPAVPLLMGAAADPEVGALVARLASGDAVGAGSDPHGSSAAPVTSARTAPRARREAGADHGRDPEDVRYAPRAPHRLRWVARSLATIGILALALAGGRAAYGWTQTQYYVTADGGQVAIYRGVPQHVPGLTLSHLYSRSTDVAVSALPEDYRRRVVGQTLPADTVTQAQAIVANLAGLARRCAPTPAPAPAPVPTTAPRPPAPPYLAPTARPPGVPAPVPPAAVAVPAPTPPAARDRTGCGGGVDLAFPTPSATPTPTPSAAIR